VDSAGPLVGGQWRRCRVSGRRRRSRGRRQGRLTRARVEQPIKLDAVVLFYEILLVACTVVITWFALYAVYRLISDDS
jgi:hypothetical protein